MINLNAEVASIAARLDQALLPVARERLQRLGARGSGSYDFYTSRIERNRLIADYDVALAGRILDWGIAPKRIHEIGGGFGTLSLLLAVAGFDVICVESDEARYNTLATFLDVLSEAFPSAAQRCRASHASFPCDLDANEALAVVTNLGVSTSPDARRKIISSLAAYQFAIVDIDHFFTPAESDPEREQRLRAFRNEGCVAELFIGLGTSGQFYLFRPEELLLTRPFALDGGYSWTATLPSWARRFGDHPDGLAQSPFTLAEDGRALGPPHQPHDKVRTIGAGYYSHWRHRIYFSTSDNSDPNVNGRRYGLRAASLLRPDSVSTGNRSNPEAAAGKSSGPTEGSTATMIIERKDVSALVEHLKGRDIDFVVYFHTDHFEPWFSRNEDEQWRGLERFAKLAAATVGGKKLSLFYTPLIFCHPRAERGSNGFSVYPDEIVFVDRKPAFVEKCRQLVAPLFTAFGHECHLHVHHEYWTRTTEVYRGTVAQWANQNSTPEADERRLDLFVQLSLRALREELERPLKEWGFVHGCWALNGADDTVCQIDSEIEILMRNGCFGDFTFPAGRSKCNPTMVKAPYTCWPIRGRKSYDTPAADPRPVGAGAFEEPGRFLIWNSRITAEHSSLDYYDDRNRERFRAPENVVQRWVDDSNVIGRRLFIKTHAHSLDSRYKVWNEDGVIPHAHAAVTPLFDLLERMCDVAKVPFEPATVDTVRAHLQQADGESRALRTDAGARQQSAAQSGAVPA